MSTLIHPFELAKMSIDSSSDNPLFIRKNQQLYRLEYDDIVFIQTDGNYSFIHGTEGSRYAVKMSLRKLSEMLPNDTFQRVHKSFLIHLKFLKQVNLNDRIAYVNGREIPIGRTYVQDLTRRLRII